MFYFPLPVFVFFSGYTCLLLAHQSCVFKPLFFPLVRLSSSLLSGVNCAFPVSLPRSCICSSCALSCFCPLWLSDLFSWIPLHLVLLPATLSLAFYCLHFVFSQFFVNKASFPLVFAPACRCVYIWVLAFLLNLAKTFKWPKLKTMHHH